MASVPTNTIGLFMVPLADEFGWPRSQISLVAFINYLVIGPAAPFMGAVIDRVGVRRIALVGCVVSPLAVSGLSLIQSQVATFWLGWLLVAIAQLFAGAMVWTMPIARHFEKHRGFALAVVLAGTAVLGATYPLCATLLIDHLGWRAAYAISGVAMFIFVTPVAFILLRGAEAGWVA